MAPLTNGDGDSKVVNVGIIGCGEITQVVHLPTLAFLSDLFRVTYLCDVSDDALRHCSKKTLGNMPETTRNPVELCSSSLVDVVLIANSDEYHAEHAILALKHNKTCFTEKPVALCQRDMDQILAAEKQSKGKLMVGYMRRYAPAFLDGLQAIGGVDKILYARVRGSY